jgi:ABC-type transport system substrate-binding protein
MMDGVWEHDVRIPTTVYPDYAGDDGPSIEKLEFTIIQDEATAYNEALAGGIDVLDVVPTDNLPTYQADFPDSNAEFLTTGFDYLGVPTYLPQFTKEHRQALSMAIDRPAITEAIFLGARDPAYSVIPPNLGGRDEVCPSWSYDPEGAKALWDAAGDPGPITVWFNSGGGHEAWVEAVANMWGENLGIDTGAITFETLEFSEYLPLLDNQEVTGPFRLGWGMDYPSPLNFLEPLYASYSFPTVGSNNTFYDNPDFDQALADGKSKVAASGLLEDGIGDYFAAEDMLCDDSQVFPMFFSKAQTVWNADTASNVFVDAYRDLGYSNVESTTGEIKTRIVEPEHLFPTTSNESEGVAVLRAVFRGLVNLDAETNEMYNAHAESITSDDGGVTWTVVLKPGWTFHDGTPVTAESYVNAWNYGADGANAQQNNSFYANIVGYDVLNPEEG